MMDHKMIKDDPVLKSNVNCKQEWSELDTEVISTCLSFSLDFDQMFIGDREYKHDRNQACFLLKSLDTESKLLLAKIKPQLQGENWIMSLKC